MGRFGARPVEIVVGVGGSLVVLAVLLLRPAGWEAVAIVGATLLPAGLVLYGGTAARRASELERRQAQLVAQRETIVAEAGDRGRSRAELQERVAELVAINELGQALSSTLELDELLDRALSAVVAHLHFDRALVLLVDEAAGTLGGGRSIGGSAEMTALVDGFSVPLAATESKLVQLALADGPLVFRDVDQDQYEPNRAFAAAVGATSFLGTPLVTKGRSVGLLAVDNRLSGRGVERSMGPLLFTLGNLLAAAVENARLYGEIEEQNRELEARVARRTAQLADATEEAQAARAAAEAASASKSQFLANVSHELRTPLTSVIGFTKLVRKRLEEVVFPALARSTVTPGAAGSGPVDPKLERATRQVGENLAIMIAEGERLTALINDVLDLEKIEAGAMEFRRDPVDVGAVAEQAIAATAALFETPALELQREIEDDLPPVIGDQHRLIQVVINLLSNAVKFTPSGSVTVRVETRRVASGDGAPGDSSPVATPPLPADPSPVATPLLPADPPPVATPPLPAAATLPPDLVMTPHSSRTPAGPVEIVVSVTDTGAGIRSEDHERVFEQFAQAGDTLTDKPRGTGLGLSISRQIVEGHGGRLWLESAPGAGSTFSFSLPVPSD
jgi:signal transduction histidine kinase